MSSFSSAGLTVLLSLILCGIFNSFQLCAYYGDETQASAWAKLAGELWKTSWGVESPQVATMANLERDPKSFRAWAGLRRKKLPPPVSLLPHLFI